ncbi:MAG: carboxypeptidase regulatory-like domain-containing protein, partial [Planctomycetota bacterium]
IGLGMWALHSLETLFEPYPPLQVTSGRVSGGKAPSPDDRGTTGQSPARRKTPGARIEGRVADRKTGETLPFARVVLQNEKGRDIHSQNTLRGRFLFDGLEEGTYRLTAQAPGYRLGKMQTVTLRRGERKVDRLILLTPHMEVSGIVRTASDGSPIEGASVWVDQIREEVRTIGPEEEASVRQTGKDGRFRRLIFEPGRHTLIATHNRFTTQSIAIEVAEEEKVSGVEFLLPSGARIQGRITNSRGFPQMGIVVKAETWPDFRDITRKTVSDEDGRFTFEGLSAGTVRVRAYPPEWAGRVLGRGHMKRVTLDGSETGKTVDLVLDMEAAEGGCRVFGTVTRDGKPVPHILVRFRSQTDRRRRETRTDASGAFAFPRLPPGAYIVTLGNAKVEVTVPNSAEYACPLRIPSSQVKGRVIDAVTGSPVEGAMVGMWMEGLSGTLPTVQTDGSGSFTFTGISPGTYGIMVIKSGYLRHSRPGVVVGEEAVVEGIEILLERGGSFRGTVTDAEGRALAGVKVGVAVQLKGKDGSSGGGIQVHTLDPEGCFEVKGLPAGTLTVHVYGVDAAGSRLTGIQIEDGATARGTLHLSRGGTLRFQVTDESGKPLADATLRLTYPDGEEVHIGYRGEDMDIHAAAEAVSDAAGRVEQERIPPGVLCVKVARRGYAPVEFKVSLADGERVERIVRLKRK